MALGGSIEHLITSTNRGGTRDAFVAMAKCFDAKYTRIASYYGRTDLGDGAGTGLTGYTGEAGMPGENAWGVWRMATTPKVYVMLRFCHDRSLGDSGGEASPANSGVFIQMCADTADPASPGPWNGTTNNDGADSYASGPTLIWTPPGAGSLFIAPRGNSLNGTWVGKRERYMMVTNAVWGSTPMRVSMLTNTDSFTILVDRHNTGYYRATHFGPYVPRTGIDLTTPKFAAFCCDLPIATGTEYGPQYTNTGDGGGILDPKDVTLGTYSFYRDRLGWVASLQPNELPATVETDEMAMPIGIYQGGAGARRGYAGDLAYIGEVFGLQTHDTNADLTRAVFGEVTLQNWKLVVPWDGATVPGTGVTRDGVQF